MWHINITKCVDRLDTQSVKVLWRYNILAKNGRQKCVKIPKKNAIKSKEIPLIAVTSGMPIFKNCLTTKVNLRKENINFKNWRSGLRTFFACLDSLNHKTCFHWIILFIFLEIFNYFPIKFIKTDLNIFD